MAVASRATGWRIASKALPPNPSLGWRLLAPEEEIGVRRTQGAWRRGRRRGRGGRGGRDGSRVRTVEEGQVQEAEEENGGVEEQVSEISNVHQWRDQWSSSESD